MHTPEDRWRLLFDNMTVGFALHEVVQDADGKVVDYRFLEVNPAFEQMTGMSASAIVGRTLLEVLPDTESYWIDTFGQVALTGQPITYENYSRELGRWYATRSFCPQHGQFAVMVTDISRSKLVEEDLRDALDFSRTLLESLSDGLAVADLEGRMVKVNEALCRMTGFDRTTLLASPPPYPYFNAHASAIYLAMQARMLLPGAGDMEECELTVTRLDGREFPALITQSVVRNGHGVVINLITTVKDITERKRAEAEILSLGLFDTLTGLPNRRLLGEKLDTARASSERHNDHAALMFIDLDHFKKLNDSKGHELGDRLLCEVGKRLRGALREVDTVSRIGGDEFVVLIESLSADVAKAAYQVEEIAGKLRHTLHQPYRLPGAISDYFTSASIGVTLFRGNTPDTEALLRQADLAMYQAKAVGRNSVRFFDPAMQVAIDERLAIEQAMRTGLDNGDFMLFYQPQVNYEGTLTGMEALLRWQHADHGLVPPAQFIAIAEETGLIVDIGWEVLRQVCRILSLWREVPHLSHLHIAVNVSVHQFRQPDFVDQVRHTLQLSGAPPDRLKLELTESVVLDRADEAIGAMQALSAIGVEFSLDDFGTGYSSLAYLKRLPLQQVKIDQTFVRDILDDPSDAAIVRAIVAMSHSLGLEVIAEGVETRSQYDFLRQLGCHSFQGYLFGKPAPISNLFSALGMHEPWSAYVAQGPQAG